MQVSAFKDETTPLCTALVVMQVKRQLKVNDLVWVVDENVKLSNYKTARVLEVQEGNYGIVRSGTVATRDGKLKRPVIKLAPLFYESVFQEKLKQDEQLNLERD